MMMINPNFANAIFNLANKLSRRNIPHTINVLWDGLQIKFPWNNGDFVCHSASYGHEVGDVESMGCPWDEGDVTRLTVDEAFRNIFVWYTESEF
jgi:hypothetical protein